MRAAIIWGLTLAALAPAGAIAALPLQVERVAAPAQLQHGAKKTPLAPRRALDAGDRLYIGHGGRAGLKLVPSGEVLVGEDSELFVHSAEAGSDGDGTIVRMALARGSLHLDSLPRDGQPPGDMRLNVGSVRVRVLGAEVWAGVEPGMNQTVCLLQGAVEVSTDFGSEKLDTPGDCFRYGANNVRMRLRPESDGVLARKLARTAFAGERPLAAPPVTAAAPLAPASPPAPIQYATTAAPVVQAEPVAPPVVEVIAPPPAPVLAPVAAPARPMAPPAEEAHAVMPAVVSHTARMTPAMPALTPAPQDVVVAAPVAPAPAEKVAVSAPPPAPSRNTYAPIPLTPAPQQAPRQTATYAPAPAPAAAVSGRGEWTVVVLSVRSIGSARDEVTRLGNRGLPAEVRPAPNSMNRITIGRFTTKETAREYAAELLEREQLKGWVTQVD